MTPIQSLILKAVCINVPIYILLLGPKDAVLKYIWAHRHDVKSSLRMWHYETLAVCALVAAVVILSGNDPVEWVGFAALTLAHGRNSVMFRLTEAQQRSTPVDPHHVECWRWNTIYFLLAECFWAGYFVLHRSWAALAGVAIFVGYGQWRRWYGRRLPSAEKLKRALEVAELRRDKKIRYMMIGEGIANGDISKDAERQRCEGGCSFTNGKCMICELKQRGDKARPLTYADIKAVREKLQAHSCPTEEVACIKCGHVDNCYIIGDGPRLPYVCAACLKHPSTCICNVCMTTT